MKMKKILPLIFVAVLMIFSVTQANATIYPDFQTANYPNGDYMEFWPYTYFDGNDSVVITFASDGNAYATALDIDGWPSLNYYQMYYDYYTNVLYCSEDGDYWFVCP